MHSALFNATVMKKRTLFFILISAIAAAAAGWFYLQQKQQTSQQTEPMVVVERGSVTDKVLAVGTIEPEQQVEVKSKVSGVVSRIFAKPGTYVNEGDPLIEVRPDPTPLELAEGRRNIELSEIQLATIKQNLERQSQLMARDIISRSEYQETERQFNDARVRVQMAQERLALLESGRVTMGDIEIESIIKAPVSGYILERMADIGDPVVPLTSYQAGTPLMIIADMDRLLFKGTVDEIDVGRIQEGMPVQLKIGALPQAQVSGMLRHIALRANRADNTTVFRVEIDITNAGGSVLRAGYSANADFVINQLDEVLLIPERVIVFRDNRTFVEVPDESAENGGRREVEIRSGTGNAILIEVKEGLEEGQKVFERPLRSLSM